MEQHYAVINSDNFVVNVVVWDGVAKFNPGKDLTLVALPYVEQEDGHRRYTGGIGWDYVDGEFVDNRPVEEMPA